MLNLIWVTSLLVLIRGGAYKLAPTYQFKPALFAEFRLFVKALFVFLLFGTLSNLFSFGMRQITNPIFNMTFRKRFFLVFFVSVFTYSLGRMLASFLPKGTPMALVPMLSVLELVRLIVRPFTLVIRITVNLLVGHLLLGGISSLLANFRVSGPPLALIIGLFELAVAFIQAFIFTLLIKLYIIDHSLVRLYYGFGP